MAKVFQKSTLEVFHMDEKSGKEKRIKSLQNLVETADEQSVKEIGEALKILMNDTVSYVTVVSHYRHTIAFSHHKPLSYIFMSILYKKEYIHRACACVRARARVGTRTSGTRSGNEDMVLDLR